MQQVPGGWEGLLEESGHRRETPGAESPAWQLDPGLVGSVQEVMGLRVWEASKETSKEVSLPLKVQDQSLVAVL